MPKNKKALRRIRIRGRIRVKVRGTAERPRLSVFRSNKHIYAQVINDDLGHTLAAASSAEADAADGTPPVEAGKAVGLLVAERAKAAGVDTVLFDRNVYRYHGRVKAVAEGAREGGLQF